jgi:hypothetical protein
MLEGIFNTTPVFLVLGVVIVLLLSFAAMTIVEWLASTFRWRANYLEMAIRHMLSDDDMTGKFYQHPLIANLYQFGEKRNRDRFYDYRDQKKRPPIPSYIPASKFVMALFDMWTAADVFPQAFEWYSNGLAGSLTAADPFLRQQIVEGFQEILASAGELAASDLLYTPTDGLFKSIQDFQNKFPETGPIISELLPEWEDIFKALVSMQKEATPDNAVTLEPALRRFLVFLILLMHDKIHWNRHLHETLAALWRNALQTLPASGSLVQHFHLVLEGWFKDAMDNLSNANKRRTQTAFFVVGIVLALILNIDSGRILSSLWYQATFTQRQSLIQMATTLLQPAANSSSQSSAVQADTGISPLGIKVSQEFLTEFDILSFPMGWQFAPFDTGGAQCAFWPVRSGQVWGIPARDSLGEPVCNRLSNAPTDFLGWLGKLAGLFATGAFVPVGGSLLFNMLGKLAANRNEPAQEPA